MPVMNTCAGNPGGCTLHFPLFQSEKITPGTELKTTAKKNPSFLVWPEPFYPILPGKQEKAGKSH
jgi:hypothetical protein